MCEAQTDRVREANRIYKHRRYGRLRAQGLCVLCAITPTLNGAVYCPSCSDRIGSRHTALRAERIATGLCVRCGKPAVPGRRQCFEHLLDGTERVRKLRTRQKRERIAQNVCVDCGINPPYEGMLRCEACLNKIRVALVKHRVKQREGHNG